MSEATLSLCERVSLPGIKSIVLDEDAIQLRCRQLAAAIRSDLGSRDLVVVGVLTGGFMFACDLVRELGFPVRLEFISISRYAGAATSGEVQILKDVQDELTGKHVLLVEDIVDTGVSLHYLGRTLLLRRPASLSICALLERPALRLAEVPVRYVGFQLNSEFLVGYGLDYRGRYRNLPYLATLEDGPGPRFS